MDACTCTTTLPDASRDFLSGAESGAREARADHWTHAQAHAYVSQYPARDTRESGFAFGVLVATLSR